MSEFTDYAFSYMTGAIEALIQYHFFMKFIDRKAKPLPCFGFVLASMFTFAFIPAGLSQLFCIMLLSCTGIFFHKAPFANSILYAAITAAIMQICYGIFNSVSIVLFPVYYAAFSSLAGTWLMITSSVLALLLSILCYDTFYRFFSCSEAEKNRYVLMILTPLLMIFLLNEYINQSIYGNTVTINRNGEILYKDMVPMLAIQVLSILSLFCILYAYKKLVESFKASTRLLSLEQERHYQNQYVSEAKARYEKTRAFRHDVKNHLSVIHGLLEKGDLSEAVSYLEDVEILTNDLSFPCHTGNPVVDILTGNKLGIAKNNGIRVSCQLELPYPCVITDMDFCIILSNALDNAIHACESLKKKEEAYIQILGRRQGDFIFMEVKNSYHGTPFFKAGTGLSNIKSVCDKYNGAMNTSSQDSCFCLNVLLIIPQHAESISPPGY